MLQGFKLRKTDWFLTPQPVRAAALALQHQVLSLQIRFTAYEQRLASLREKEAEVKRLKLEVKALQEKLGKNSHNSSLPPSSDLPPRKARTHRGPSGKRQGAQPGHTGHGRKLKPEQEVDRVVNLRPDKCGTCGRRLQGSDPAPARRQVTEIPPAKAEVTEYRRHTLRCRCGTINEVKWSAGIPRGSFGARVQATVAYFTGRLGLSHRDVVETMKALHGVEISAGSVSAIERRVSGALASPVETARDFVHGRSVKYVDETGWPEKGKLRWLWLNATESVTYFRVMSRRDQAAAREMIGQAKHGIVTTDRYLGYSWLSLDRRQICWAHLKRDFQAISERTGEAQHIGGSLLAQAKKLFHLWHQIRDGALSRHDFEEQMLTLRKRVKGLLKQGARCAEAKTRRTCQQILQLEKALWTFVRVEGLEPTNNRAERALRRAVLWRRKSFGTQSEGGSLFVGRVLTAVATLRQQGRGVLEYLTAVCSSGTQAKQSVCLLPR